MVKIRLGDVADFEAAIRVWRAAEGARRRAPVSPSQEDRTVRYLNQPDAFLVVAGDESKVIGMAVGMQGLADDGEGPPIDGLCHIGAVFVSPDRWGEGIGRQLLATVVSEARARGYVRAQLWTHADNERSQRLYESSGFVRSGREKPDEDGKTITHYQVELAPST